MGKIALEGLEFFAYHGFYKNEREIGNKFGVDLEITADVSDTEANDNLQMTINYEDLYKIVKREMMMPSKLLEHLAHKISASIMENFPQVIDVSVSVKKFNPPIGGICKSAKVTIFKKRK